MAKRWVCLSDKEIKELSDYVEGTGQGMLKQVLPIIKKLQGRQKRITTASAKQKGRDLQQWVCRKIASLFEMSYDQQDDNCLIHSREMGQSGVDIVLRGYVAKMFPFAIECKSTEKMDLPAFIRQAQSHQSTGRHWMVVYKGRALSQPVVIISWEALEELYLGLIRLGKRSGWEEK